MPEENKKYKLNTKTSFRKPRGIVIGSSTGGLQAISKIFEDLKGSKISLPILITQHIPENFDKSFAETISQVSGMDARVAVDGEELIDGKIYIAPSNCHLSLINIFDKIKVNLLDLPPINFCKPSVDPLFSSAAEVWNGYVIGVILTGIGSDGLNGCRDIVKTGGTVITQDEETSVVWGMPGAVTKDGISSQVLPIDKIAEFLKNNSFGKIL